MNTFATDSTLWPNARVAELLISQTALTQLSLNDALTIVRRMHTTRIKQGTVLVQEGMSSNNMFLILRGEAVVENESLKKSESLILGVVGKGHIVGEMGLLDDQPRSATCTAFSEMDVAVLDRTALADLISMEPATGCKLLAALLHRTSSRLRATNKKLRVLSQINRALEQEIGVSSSVTSKPENRPKPPSASALPDNPLMF